MELVMFIMELVILGCNKLWKQGVVMELVINRILFISLVMFMELVMFIMELVILGCVVKEGSCDVVNSKKLRKQGKKIKKKKNL